LVKVKGESIASLPYCSIANGFGLFVQYQMISGVLYKLVQLLNIKSFLTNQQWNNGTIGQWTLLTSFLFTLNMYLDLKRDNWIEEKNNSR
jgi:hypothetical protein